jgi:hypothetical protein
LAIFAAGGSLCAQQEIKSEARMLTHADAAVFLARYSGLFDRYLSRDADLNECVSFLNRHGIYFGLLEVVNGAEFTKQDCARAMGQIELVFSGEAEFSQGKVKLPKKIVSWEEFCILNDVKYSEGYHYMLELMQGMVLHIF